MLKWLDTWFWTYEDRWWARPFGWDWMLPIQRWLDRVVNNEIW